MSLEGKFSWDFLKIVADTLDSYRIRVLIDAKNDIINAGIYSEPQYNTILFNMFNEEKLKYHLLNFLKNKKEKNIKVIKEFSESISISLNKTYSLLELLKNEHLIEIEELYDKKESENNNSNSLILQDLAIKINHINPVNYRSIYEPVKVIFDSNNCSGCGLCSGICPMNCLNIYNGFGKIDEEKCIKCGLCYLFCPRSFLPTRILNMTIENTSEIKSYSMIGYYSGIYSARTKVEEISKVCQDGGISSTCLYYLLEKDEIDYALGAQMSKTPWRPEPLLIKSKEDILSTAGTKYVSNATLTLLKDLNNKTSRLAIVGVPCMMQSLLKSEIYSIGIPSISNVKYRIGIFCMESFSYESLLKICEKLDLDIKTIKKMDINKGKFFAHTSNGEFNIPIKEISHLARPDCEVCYDLTSESADISVGSIGSPSGWNTVIIRTKLGRELFNKLISNNLIESKSIEKVQPGLSLLQKVAGTKRNTCKKHINTRLNENLRIPQY
ncbi:MAG: Coenzyme F420 hydrogenase/dehydrogenase, beta subunit C-terminal domain [Promethearchaeota archaeon]